MSFHINFSRGGEENLAKSREVRPHALSNFLQTWELQVWNYLEAEEDLPHHVSWLNSQHHVISTVFSLVTISPRLSTWSPILILVMILLGSSCPWAPQPNQRVYFPNFPLTRCNGNDKIWVNNWNRKWEREQNEEEA